jgi:hypothetical protein
MKLRMRKMPRPLPSAGSPAREGRDLFGIEAFTLVADADGQLGPTAESGCRKFNEYPLAGIVAVAMLVALMTPLNGLDTLTQCCEVLVETHVPNDVVTDDLDEVQHLEGAAELEADDFRVRCWRSCRRGNCTRPPDDVKPVVT